MQPEKVKRPRRPPPIDLAAWLDAAVGFAEHVGAQDIIDELLRRAPERALDAAKALDRLAAGVLAEVERFIGDEVDGG